MDINLIMMENLYAFLCKKHSKMEVEFKKISYDLPQIKEEIEKYKSNDNGHLAICSVASKGRLVAESYGTFIIGLKNSIKEIYGVIESVTKTFDLINTNGSFNELNGNDTIIDKQYVINGTINNE